MGSVGRCVAIGGLALFLCLLRPAQAYPEHPQLHAFFNIYGNPREDGRWMGWNLSHIRPDGSLSPANPYRPEFEDIASSFFPILGPYSSANTTVLKYHLEWLEEAGVDAIVVSWTGGRDEKGPSRELVERVLEQIFTTCESYRVKVAFQIEGYMGRNPSSVRKDIAYLVDRYGGRAAMARLPSIRSAKLLPVIYISDANSDEPDAWGQLFSGPESPHGSRVRGSKGEANPLCVRDGEHDVVALSLVTEKSDVHGFVRPAGFDGFYTYYAAHGVTYAANPEVWAKLSHEAESFEEGEHHLYFVPCAGPGYQDDRLRPWNAEEAMGRDRGDFFKHGLNEIANIHPMPIVAGITSWNHWGEGTQIEPARPKKIEGHTYQDYAPDQPDMYIEILKEWKDSWLALHSDTEESPQEEEDHGRLEIEEEEL